jgi:hypothetical protein
MVARCGVNARSFLEDVELAVCAKLNEVTFRGQGRKAFRPKLEPLMLKDQRRSQPRAMARHMICFIAYNHPFSKGFYSSVGLGQHFRRDHTTILSGLRRAEAFIRTRHIFASHLQDVCDSLAECYGPFSVWAYFDIAEPSNLPVIKPQRTNAVQQVQKVTESKKDRRDRDIRRDRSVYLAHASGCPMALMQSRFSLGDTTIRQIVRRVRSYPQKYGVRVR